MSAAVDLTPAALAAQARELGERLEEITSPFEFDGAIAAAFGAIRDAATAAERARLRQTLIDADSHLSFACRERVAQLERELAHFKAPDALPDQTWQEVLDRALERTAQLETALRFYGEPMTYKAGAGCEYWLVPIEQDKGEKARAALAAGKP